MNDIHDKHDDWQALASDWRQQAGSRIDTDALMHEVRKRGRRLRWALLSEMATLAFTLALSGWVWLSPKLSHEPRLLIGALAIGVLVFQGWALWIRRGQIHDGHLDAAALLSLDIQRTRTTLRYWRVSVWVAVAMWLALYATLWAGLAAPVPGDVGMLRKLMHSVVATSLVGVGGAAWAWWWSRRHLRRLDRMRQLRDELEQG